MTIRFPNPADVRLKYAETLAAWNHPTPLLSAEAFAQMEVVRRWSLRSPTAQRIIKYVEDAKVLINVVCFKNGGGTVFSANDPPGSGQGVIFWDVEARFATKQIGKDGTETRGDFHHFIAFLHEMGHALQWIENPTFYEGNMLHGGEGAKKIADAAKAFWMKKAQKSGLTAHRAKGVFANDRMQLDTGPTAKPNWAVRVEMDNLRRHEWPICDEARYPRRLGYTDLMNA